MGGNTFDRAVEMAGSLYERDTARRIVVETLQKSRETPTPERAAAASKLLVEALEFNTLQYANRMAGLVAEMLESLEKELTDESQRVKTSS